ncbi:uncharacterized protein LOC124910537 [Impatiens glandulifera]|uniref:uncharacterized protein LOC124910537 n=1 Tax=Impatiens glandulifera TaxID=253017 RepID=UPI001FB08D1D|nr:uncharacterized protein LOC124910537 [Impatiens glandulifera]XP_047307155.1 uncharacterized protein LOC124910537 [Impatiens glandulifera]
MAVALTHLSRWLWSGKHKEPKISKTVSSSSSSPSTSNIQSDSSSSSNRRNMKGRKWRSGDEEEEEGEIDKEYVLVQVQSDCCESDDLDWSIGWLEQHGSEFQGEVDSENSFAVLVPCYGRGYMNIHGGGNQSSTEGNSYMEKWISYLQKS